MRILITALDLTRRGGAQLFVRDLAIGVLQMGHEPVVYSPALGAVAREIRRWTIPVTSDLRTISAPPEVIVGNYHLGTMTALMRFPDCGAILISHGFDIPIVPRFPRIHRHVAVDEPTRGALVSVHGIEEEKVSLIFNAVDLGRFRAREGLPARPRRALVFGNQFVEGPQLDAIRAACERRGIGVDLAGRGGRVAEEPEKILLDYDIVFARARCALEAMASGAAVILAGPTRLGTLVTPDTLEALRPLNFGRRTLQTTITVDRILEQIDRYDPGAAAEVTRWIRETASLESMATEILRLSEEVVEEQGSLARDPEGEAGAMADYLASLERDYAMKFERIMAWVSSWPLIGGVALNLVRRVKRSIFG